MAILSTTQKNNLATAYKNAATHAALYSSSPTATEGGTEPSGGSPAYARMPITWGAVSNGSVTASVTFNVPSGFTVSAAGVHSAVSGTGNFLDGGSVTSQLFNSQGTYTLTLTYTQS